MTRDAHSYRFIILSLMSAFALSACGIKGNLETPPPLWGEDTRTQAEIESAQEAEDYRAEQEAAKAARKASN